MIIENAKYVEDDNGNNMNVLATIDGVDLCIPISEGNRHYAEIMRQVAEGTLTIAEAD
tara:strand:- start:415 stop:588 length:174 start_codon:yes stop_codon:yes gene_type:complete